MSLAKPIYCYQVVACPDCNRAWRRDNGRCPLCNTLFELRGFDNSLLVTIPKPGACSGIVENRTDAQPSAAAVTDSSKEFE